ncbi:S24 family peptidase [Acholeplasma sp. OttesenSCG-928-E16]|nr:S24 family peptidase [Acholeplasma sp. OttesenSCG-928-E16]
MKTMEIPVYSNITHGILNSIIGYEEIPKRWTKTAEYFGLQVHDDSMAPEIAHNDILIIRSVDHANSGDIVLVSVNGELPICRKILYTEFGIRLVVFNSKYATHFYSSEDLKRMYIQVIGRVQRIIRYYNGAGYEI